MSHPYFGHSSYYACFYNSRIVIHLTSPLGVFIHLCGYSQKSIQFLRIGFTSIKKSPVALQLGQHSTYLSLSIALPNLDHAKALIRCPSYISLYLKKDNNVPRIPQKRFNEPTPALNPCL